MNICDSQYVVTVSSGFLSAPSTRFMMTLRCKLNKIYGSKIVCKAIIILLPRDLDLQEDGDAET